MRRAKVIETVKSKVKSKLQLTLAATTPLLATLNAFAATSSSNTSISITPTAPVNSSALTTVLGYLEWLGIVGGVGLGTLLAGIKIGLHHDMESGKRDVVYSVLGGIIISAIAAILKMFV